MRYRIKNTAKAPRVVYNINRRPKNIAPGQTVEMDLDSSTAGRIVTHDSGLDVTQVGPGDAPEPVRNDPPPPAAKEPSPSAEENKTRTAAELVAAIDDKSINYSQIMSEAKVILGDQWPGGVPKKTKLRELLVASE